VNATVGSAAVHCAAQLIEQRLGARIGAPLLAKLPRAIRLHLGQLSLDGLCRTLWILGHGVAGVETRALRPATPQRRANHIEAMIDVAFDILMDWPTSLHTHLQRRLGQQTSKSTNTPNRCLLRQLCTDLQPRPADDELAFLRHAVERAMGVVWSGRGQTTPRPHKRQLEFIFSE